MENKLKNIQPNFIGGEATGPATNAVTRPKTKCEAYDLHFACDFMGYETCVFYDFRFVIR